MSKSNFNCTLSNAGKKISESDRPAIDVVSLALSFKNSGNAARDAIDEAINDVSNELIDQEYFGLIGEIIPQSDNLN